MEEGGISIHLDLKEEEEGGVWLLVWVQRCRVCAMELEHLAGGGFGRGSHKRRRPRRSMEGGVRG